MSWHNRQWQPMHPGGLRSEERSILRKILHESYRRNVDPNLEFVKILTVLFVLWNAIFCLSLYSVEKYIYDPTRFRLFLFLVSHWSHGVMVSTLDFESSDPSSNLGGTWLIFFYQLEYYSSLWKFNWKVLEIINLYQLVFCHTFFVASRTCEIPRSVIRILMIFFFFFFFFSRATHCN